MEDGSLCYPHGVTAGVGRRRSFPNYTASGVQANRAAVLLSGMATRTDQEVLPLQAALQLEDEHRHGVPDCQQWQCYLSLILNLFVRRVEAMGTERRVKAIGDWCNWRKVLAQLVT